MKNLSLKVRFKIISFFLEIVFVKIKNSCIFAHDFNEVKVVSR